MISCLKFIPIIGYQYRYQCLYLCSIYNLHWMMTQLWRVVAESEVEAGDAQLAVSHLMFSDARDVGDTPSQHLKGRLWKCVRWQALFYQGIKDDLIWARDAPGKAQPKAVEFLVLRIKSKLHVVFSLNVRILHLRWYFIQTPGKAFVLPPV